LSPVFDVSRLGVLGVRWLGAHDEKVMGCAFSPDGKLVATGSGDGQVLIWNRESPDEAAKPIQRLPAHRPVSWCVAFSPDGRRLITAGHDSHVFVWETRHWTRLDDVTVNATAKGHEIEALAISDEDEPKVAVGDITGAVVVYRLQSTGRLVPMKTLKAHTKGVSCAAWLPDGDLLTGGIDCRVVRTELASGNSREIASAPRQMIVSLALSPDAETFVTAGWRPAIADVWRIDGTPVARLEGHTKAIRSVAFSPDGTLVATGSLDQTVKLWSTADWKEVLRDSRFDVGVPVGTLAFSPAGTEIVVGADDNETMLGRGRVCLWALGER
jgi:WD40 repeat protein